MEESKILTDRQRRFIEEYCIDFNGTQAAIRAGYGVKCASVQANENLRKPYIKSEIQKHQQQLAERSKLKKDDILDGLRCDIEADPLDLFDNDGNLKSLSDMPKDLRRSLIIELEELRDERSGKVTGSRIRSLKFRDAGKARELYGRYLGMWNDKIEVSGKLSVDQVKVWETARKRAIEKDIVL